MKTTMSQISSSWNPVKVTTLIVVILTGMLAMPLQAATITLKKGLDGYTGSDDTVLVNQGGNYDFNYGGRDWVQVASTRTGVYRFDVTSLAALEPAYASIDSITLKLWIDFTATDNTYTVSLLKEGNAGWVEGTLTGAYQAGSASWYYAQTPNVAWLGGQNGAKTASDIYGAISSSFTLTAAGNPVGSYVEIPLSALGLPENVNSLTEIIDLWSQNGGVNNAGFIITGSGSGLWRFESNESLNGAAYYPELIITYTPIPEPSSLLLLGLAALIPMRGWRRK